MDCCSGNQLSHSTITAGSAWDGALDFTGCSTIYLDTQVSGTHPAGDLKFLQNGVVVRTHHINQNQSVLYDDSFSATCGDFFEIIW